jgi:hypothetical protein
LATGVASASQLNLALGSSVPADPSGATLIEKAGPTRASGGEHIVVRLNGAKTITEIKLSAFSNGKAGKVLIHNATGTAAAAVVSLDGLFKFASATDGNPTNYQNLVMLPDAASVRVTPAQAFSRLEFVVEGFTNNDASLLISITASEDLPAQDYLITRTGSAEVVGGMIDESGYKKFSSDNLKNLMTGATTSVAADLVGKTYVCTSYTKLDTAEIDFKTRTFAQAANGDLISNSDLEDPNLAWASTAEGLEATILDSSGCGHFVTKNIVRQTGSGNLISEVVLNLNDYVNLCAGAGYDPSAVQAVETNSTFASVVDPAYVVNAYEFCRPSK